MNFCDYCGRLISEPHHSCKEKFETLALPDDVPRSTGAYRAPTYTPPEAKVEPPRYDVKTIRNPSQREINRYLRDGWEIMDTREKGGILNLGVSKRVGVGFYNSKIDKITLRRVK